MIENIRQLSRNDRKHTTAVIFFIYIFGPPPSATTSRGPADVHFLAYLNMQIIADHIKICYLFSQVDPPGSRSIITLHIVGLSESTTRQRQEAEFTSNSKHFVRGDVCESTLSPSRNRPLYKLSKQCLVITHVFTEKENGCIILYYLAAWIQIMFSEFRVLVPWLLLLSIEEEIFRKLFFLCYATIFWIAKLLRIFLHLNAYCQYAKYYLNERPYLKCIGYLLLFFPLQS